MCEKVKLTQEQAREIERIKKYFNRHEYITKFVESNGVSDSEFHIEELVRALYIGYEVEPEFKVRDFVKNDRGRVVEILEDKGNSFVVGWIANGKLYKETVSKNSILRHVTKQEIWWASHGRGVWELKGHDILTHRFYGGNYAVFSVRNDLVTFYGPNEDRMLGDVRKNFKVKYFAEDRKDA